MKKTFFLPFILFISIAAFCQNKNIEKLHFTSINQLGFAVVNGNNNWQIQTINGIRYKTWSAGLGIGIDWQNTRSVPFFLDIRKQLSEHKNNWFLYVDAGENMAWKNKDFIYYNQVSAHYSNTFYAESGIGYSIALKNKRAFLLSLGYGNKSSEYTYTYIIFSDPMAGSSTIVTGIDRSNSNRLILKTAIQF